MVKIFLSKKNWYTKRDTRTKELIGGFKNFSLGVIIDDEQISNFSIQIMSLIALNIFSRWCRNIKIEVHKTLISCIPNYERADFIDLLKKTMESADPYGSFSFGDINEKDCNEIIVIGKTKKKLNKPHVCINSSGWISGITYGSSLVSLETNGTNPIGPAFAACLGVAEVFRQAVNIFPKKYYSDWFSLYDFKFDLNPYNLKNPNFNLNFDFGRIYQIGCGAVGSSLSFLISLTNWKGEIVLIDFDTVDYTNCNRSLIFNARDAYKEKNKVDVCLEALKKCSFSTKVFKGSYSDFIKKGNYLNIPPDLILCLANEQNVWSTIQNNFPPIVLHATTTSNWGLNFGRHIPKENGVLCVGLVKK